MTSLGNVLIVDDSRVYREMIATVMAPHCDATLTTSSGNEAIELIRSGRAIDLVLCDVMMSEGDGFDLLEHVSSRETGAPIVVMVTAYPRERAAERAFDLGAVAYLSKPTTVRSILTAVGLSALNERRELNAPGEGGGRYADVG
jgi:CheY-like chemotaxis protein